MSSSPPGVGIVSRPHAFHWRELRFHGMFPLGWFRGGRPVFRVAGASTTRTLSLAPRPVSDRGGQFTGPIKPTCCGRSEGMSKRATSAVWVRSTARCSRPRASTFGIARGGQDRPCGAGRPGARLPTEKISRLWELAVERSGNPAIGLAQYEVARPASFDVVGYAMMSCADLRAAFERLIRYMLILSDALTMTLSKEKGGYRIPSRCTAEADRCRGAHRVYRRYGDRVLPLDQRARCASAGGRIALSPAGGSCALPHSLSLSGVV